MTPVFGPILVSRVGKICLVFFHRLGKSIEGGLEFVERSLKHGRAPSIEGRELSADQLVEIFNKLSSVL
jgi:hypothetical protein